ncbi:polysaccharide lyase [Pseudoduganella namucuonensis]|uniref:Polysaccharide lyase n=1 Tax=Pseudoduganella namucuonensis TaxID=1035707 RepID=A0A1I7K0F4_9BURK|nr:polysaccharide lyase [Pseudoduganella namucuonensis]SFU90914.1 Polysaccharide lyase [Pseudoduganella namucuonensis]
MRLTKILAAAAFLCAGGAQAQIDLARGGPVNTLSPNPNPLMYVSQNLARNLTSTYRYLDDLYSLSASSPARLSLVPDPLGSGRNVLLHNLNKTDPLVSGGSRTEVSLKYEYVIEGVRWYAVSMMFPADWQFHASPTVVAQLHTSQKTLAVPPPVSMVASGQDLNIELHYNYRNMSGQGTDPATRANTGEQLVRAAKIETNKWYCFVVRAEWSYKPGLGSMQIWMNGNIAYEASNVYNAYETWLGNYPKVGLYLPGVMQVATRNLYTDFIHVGGASSTYDMMAALTPCGVNAAATSSVIKQGVL